MRWVVFILGTVYYAYLLLQDGRTALWWASYRGYLECVEALLLGGAHPNIQTLKVSSTKRCLVKHCGGP